MIKRRQLKVKEQIAAPKKQGEKVPPAMLLYTNSVKPFIDNMDDYTAGMLFKALYKYHVTGEQITFQEPFVAAAFDVIKSGIDDGKERYKKKIAGSAYGVYCKAEKAAGRDPMPRSEWDKTNVLEIVIVD